MPLLGWSMTKAALNALIGLRIKDGRLALTDKSLLPRDGDKRRDISLDDLLHMSSGLVFDESYGDPALRRDTNAIRRGRPSEICGGESARSPTRYLLALFKRELGDSLMVCVVVVAGIGSFPERAQPVPRDSPCFPSGPQSASRQRCS
jgi:hypothetical protein